MPTFEKKPATYVAHKLTPENSEECAKWCGGGLMYTVNEANEKVLTGLVIKVGRTTVEAAPGDYLVMNQLGEYYVEPAWLFEDFYVEVTPPAEPVVDSGA